MSRIRQAFAFLRTTASKCSSLRVIPHFSFHHCLPRSTSVGTQGLSGAGRLPRLAHPYTPCFFHGCHHMWCLLCLFSMFYLFRGQQTMVSEPRSNPTMTCFGFFRHVYVGIFMRGKVYAHVCMCSCGGQTSVSADLLNYFHLGS